MSRCNPQQPAKRTAAAWAETIDRLNTSDAVKDAVACVVWFDCMSLHCGKPTPAAIMDSVRRDGQDVPKDELFDALIAVGYCAKEARYRAFDVDSYYDEIRQERKKRQKMPKKTLYRYS